MALFHIDADMGVDDTLALVVASRIAGFRIAALSTVFGNVPLATATRNARLVRHLLGDHGHFDIMSGAEAPSDGFGIDARHVHGEDGLGSATVAIGAEMLRNWQRERPVEPLQSLRSRSVEEPVTIIGLGPATNIPRLFALYGPRAVRRIVLMGGVFFDYGNIRGHAEFNAFCDPAALRATLALGVPVTIVPLDVCRKVQLSRDTVRSYLDAAPTPLMQLVVASHMHYVDNCRASEGFDGCFPHDSIAVMAAHAPEQFFRVRAAVQVDCGRETRGRTTMVPDASSHVEVVTGGHLKWVREGLKNLRF